MIKTEKYITVGFIGEADIDTEATPNDTYNNLFNISEQCGYMVVMNRPSSYHTELILSTPEGIFYIEYDRFSCEEPYKFKGVYIKKRIQ